MSALLTIGLLALGLSAAWGAKERFALAAFDSVPDGLLHEVVLDGTPDDVREGLGEYSDTGFQLVVILNPTPPASSASSRPSYRLLDDLVADAAARPTSDPTTREASQ